MWSDEHQDNYRYRLKAPGKIAPGPTLISNDFVQMTVSMTSSGRMTNHPKRHGLLMILLWPQRRNHILNLKITPQAQLEHQDQMGDPGQLGHLILIPSQQALLRLPSTRVVQ